MATVAPERPEILSEPDGLYEVIDGVVVEKPIFASERTALARELDFPLF
jgi:hypothetical protein